MVRFKVHPFQRDKTHALECVAELYDRRTVRSSAGHESIRPVILAQVELGGQEWQIELTLTRRDAMGFRMLLGRQAIRRRFRVDPGRSYLVSRALADQARQLRRARPETAGPAGGNPPATQRPDIQRPDPQQQGAQLPRNPG